MCAGTCLRTGTEIVLLGPILLRLVLFKGFHLMVVKGIGNVSVRSLKSLPAQCDSRARFLVPIVIPASVSNTLNCLDHPMSKRVIHKLRIDDLLFFFAATILSL